MQALIAERDRQGGGSRGVRLKAWGAQREAGAATLMRWVETGQYVVLTYRYGAANGNAGEPPVTFKLSGDGWVATLDLVRDPVIHYLVTGQQRIEQVIR